MSDADLARITVLLQKWQRGSRDALEDLWPLISLPLARVSRKLLRDFVRGARKGATMSTTDLVHEAFPKLSKYGSRDDRPWQNRVEFYALAKKVMLCVLLDYQRYAERHGNRSGEELPEQAPHAPMPGSLSIDDLIDLDKNLDLLRAVDPMGYQIVRLRFIEDKTIRTIIKETGWTEYKVYLHLKGALGFLHAKLKN